MLFNPSQSNLPLSPDVNCMPNLCPVIKNPGRQVNWATLIRLESNREDSVFGFFDGILICFGNGGKGRGCNVEEGLIVE
jgi:hypothetical protein